MPGKDGTGLDSRIIKAIYCLCLSLHKPFLGASKKPFPPGLASPVCLQEAFKGWGFSPVFPRSTWTTEPQAPDMYSGSAQILNRPGHSLGWAVKLNPC